MLASGHQKTYLFAQDFSSVRGFAALSGGKPPSARLWGQCL